MQHNKTTLLQLPLTTLGQETRWAYSTTPPSQHGAARRQLSEQFCLYSQANQQIPKCTSSSSPLAITVLAVYYIIFYTIW